jgi:hypothetical protein
VVMNNISAHKGPRGRELIEGMGCELLYLLPYSPDHGLRPEKRGILEENGMRV